MGIRLKCNLCSIYAYISFPPWQFSKKAPKKGEKNTIKFSSTKAFPKKLPHP